MNDVEVPAKRPRTEVARNDVLAAEQASGAKVYGLPSGMISCNAVICDLIAIVKPVIRTLVEDSNMLKMWISFMIPKVYLLIRFIIST